jgi:hypothetical protein
VFVVFPQISQGTASPSEESRGYPWLRGSLSIIPNMVS